MKMVGVIHDYGFGIKFEYTYNATVVIPLYYILTLGLIALVIWALDIFIVYFDFICTAGQVSYGENICWDNIYSFFFSFI